MPLRAASARVFLAGQAVSALGDGLALLAVPLLVLRLTNDPLAAGLAAAPRGIGYLLAGVPAGPVADRLSPWTTLIASDAVRTAVFVALPVLAWCGGARLWLVLALAFLSGAATVFFDAALAVAVKDLFPGPGLLRANSVLEAAAQASQVAGPALVGVLAAAVGPEPALLLNAATYAVSLASLAAVARRRPAARPARPARANGPVGAFAEGIRFVLAFRPLLVLTVLQTMINLCLAVDTLIVFLARVTLGLSPAAVGAVVAAGGLGGLGGALAAPALAARLGPLRTLSAAIGAVAASLAAMGLATAWWALLAANAAQMWAVTVASVVNRATRQAWIPRALMGRVTTAVRAVFLAATPVGAAAAGALTGACGDDPRPVFAGAGLAAGALIAAGWTAALRHYDASALASAGDGARPVTRPGGGGGRPGGTGPPG